MTPWYTPETVRPLLREVAFHDDDGFAEWLSKHFNLAFDKGRQIGAGELRAEVDRLNGIIDRMCAAHRPARKDGE